MVLLNKNVINNSNFMERRCGLHQGAESEITGLETLNDDHITGREVQRSAHLRQSVSVCPLFHLTQDGFSNTAFGEPLDIHHHTSAQKFIY